MRFHEVVWVRSGLWLLAHDEDRRMHPHLGLQALGIGLAGAALIDLLHAGRVRLTEGRVHVLDDWSSSGDLIADDIQLRIRALSEPPPLVPLLRDLGPGLYESTRTELLEAGVIQCHRQRLRRSQYGLTRPGTTVRMRAKIAHRATDHLIARDFATDALCALTIALGLHECLVLVYCTAREAGPLLRLVTDHIPQTQESPAAAVVPGIATAVSHAVGDLATAALL